MNLGAKVDLEKIVRLEIATSIIIPVLFYAFPAIVLWFLSGVDVIAKLVMTMLIAEHTLKVINENLGDVGKRVAKKVVGKMEVTEDDEH